MNNIVVKFVEKYQRESSWHGDTVQLQITIAPALVPQKKSKAENFHMVLQDIFKQK